MNSAAQNALLKTLEEPPQESLIILIAHQLPAGFCRPCARAVCGSVSRPCRARSRRLICKRSIERAPTTREFLAAMSMGSIGVALTLDKDELIGNETGLDRTCLSSLKAGDYPVGDDGRRGAGGKS